MQEIIIEQLKHIHKQINKVPSKVDFCKTAKIDKRKIDTLFGSYNNLVIESGLKPNRINKKIETKCKNCDKTIFKANYLHKEDGNFCSLSCSATYRNITNNPNPKKDRTCICENCNLSFEKTKDQDTNTCSRLCLMELGMKQRVLGSLIKRGHANKFDTVRQNSRAYSKFLYQPLCMRCRI